MKSFRKKGKNTVKLDDKLIAAMNFTPPDYQHTDLFHRRLKNPLDDARKDIKNIPTSSLVDESGVICDIHDPSIDALSNSEIVYGHKQYIHNVGSILQIFDSINESEPTAEAKKIHLTSDLERIEKDIIKYEEMRSKSSS